MAESQVVGWLSGRDNRWRTGAPSDRQPIGNVKAVRVEGPDPSNRGETRFYTLIGPFPQRFGVEGLDDYIDQWIENNYGEFT